MKKLLLLTILSLTLSTQNSKAQEDGTREKYGNTINLGVRLGYYGYIGYTTPALHFDYEFDLV